MRTATVFRPRAPWWRVRVVLLALLASTLLPAAAAGEECEARYHAVDPVEGSHVGAEMETRDCEGNVSWLVAVSHREGRLSIEWYDDERGVGIGAFEPPRFVWWHEDGHGCLMVVYLFGAIEQPCVLGAPPGPPPPPDQVPR